MSLEFEVIQPTGVLDSTNGGKLRREINELIDAGCRTILVDCKAVEFMDSSGLGSLVMALKKVHEMGGKLVLCSINAQLQMLFELTSMDDVFSIFPDQATFSQTGGTAS